MLIKIPENMISSRAGKVLMLHNSMLWRVGFARLTGSTGRYPLPTMVKDR